MPALRLILVCFASGFLFISLGAPNAIAQQSASFQAVMIYASNDAAKPDPRVAGIAKRLKKVFKFKHYKLAGKGNANIKVPGQGTIGLGSGFSLIVKAKGMENGRVRAQVVWKKGGASLINMQVVMSKGKPAVIGGHSHQSGKMIVTLTLK
jgi:hypothetical protein